jgi:NAD-dependent deacetylase
MWRQVRQRLFYIFTHFRVFNQKLKYIFYLTCNDRLTIMTNKVIIVCGAGISASAGIPTYRCVDNGLWKINDMEKICTKGNEFTNESLLFYDKFRYLLKSIQPSIVHRALAEIQQMYGKDRVKIFTQNIDDLLEKAGCEATHVHGKCWQARCSKCDKVVDITTESLGESYCDCGGRFKNNIVFYGERGNYQEMIEHIIDLNSDDVFILMGTSEKTIHVDMYMKFSESTNIYINPVVEESVDIHNYKHVVLQKCENCIAETKNLISQYIK